MEKISKMSLKMTEKHKTDEVRGKTSVKLVFPSEVRPNNAEAVNLPC